MNSNHRFDLLFALCLFVVVFITHLFSPNATPFDSRWTIHMAHSMIHEGDVDLNEFEDALVKDTFYAIECLTPSGQRVYPIDTATQCTGGTYYNFYPVAVPLLAAPFVAAVEAATGAAQPVLGPLAERMPTPARRAFLKGDVVASFMLCEILVASVFIAAASALMYLMARSVLQWPMALGAAFIFAFCSPAWSTGSRALWQHGPSMLLIAAALVVCVRTARQPKMFALIGALLAFAVYVRPTNVIPFAAFAAYLFFERKHNLAWFIAGTIPVAMLFTAITWSTYGTLIAPYAFVKRANAPGISFHPLFGEALLGNLISPARGLIPYVPVFLFGVYGVVHKMLPPAMQVLQRWMMAAVGAHWILISLYEDWWGGHAFGPRYFSDLTPIFIFLLLPALVRLELKPLPKWGPVFVAFVAFSCFVNYRGATAWATMEWNNSPITLRDAPWRIWDWRDPQFLRGL